MRLSRVVVADEEASGKATRQQEAMLGTVFEVAHSVTTLATASDAFSNGASLERHRRQSNCYYDSCVASAPSDHLLLLISVFSCTHGLFHARAHPAAEATMQSLTH